MTITQKATSHVRFRTDIEGLRALAVLAVVINHAGFSALPGGFLGVDIFFVISGFLITRNICRDLDAGKFKFGAFFGRRIRRLFPALVATVIVTLCISYLLLTPRLALSTAKSAISAVISLSNIWFLSEVSYFDSLATQKPLLHTWSLGVEEQFYLIWPFLLLLAGSLVGRRGYIIMMAGFGLLSLIAAQIWLLKSPSATFYLTHFRLFEFAIGGLIAALYPKGVRKKFATSIWCIGLIITFSSLIMFDKTTPMPGAWSLVPCLGVAMIIMAGGQSRFDVLLSNRVMGWLGRLSYTIYLVHWPLMVFYFILITTKPSLPHIATLIVGSVFLGWVLHIVIERPFRGKAYNGWSSSSNVSYLASAIATVLCSIIAFSCINTNGWENRNFLPELNLKPAHKLWVARNKLVRVESCFVQPQQNFSDFNKELCLKSNEVRPNILIYGDSFSSDFYAALTLAYPKINFLQATSANCLPYAKQPSNKNCESLQEYLLSDFLPNTARPLDAIILMGDWGFQHLDSIPEVIETFEPFAQKIIIGGPPIRFAENVPELAMKAGVKDFSELETLLFSKRHPADKVMPYLTEAVKDDAELWDLHKLMISQGERAFNDKRDILFIDFGHLTVEGIHFLSQQLKIQFPDGPLKNVEIKRDLKSIFNHELLTDTHFQGDTSWIFNEYPQKIHNGILVTVNSHALQPVDIKQNTEYLLTVKASCHETQTQGRLQVNWFDDDQAYITNNTKVFDCNFTGDTYESLVISPQLATRAMVYASGHSNDFIIMHDVSLKEQKVPEEQ